MRPHLLVQSVLGQPQPAFEPVPLPPLDPAILLVLVALLDSASFGTVQELLVEAHTAGSPPTVLGQPQRTVTHTCSAASRMLITVTVLPFGRVVSPEVEGSDLVEDLRGQIEELATPLLEARGMLPQQTAATEPPRLICYSAAPEYQQLFFEQTLLQDGNTLATYGLQKESELKVLLRPQQITLRLDVGGACCAVSLDTLCAVKGSRLAAMFEPLLQGSLPVHATEGNGLTTTQAPRRRTYDQGNPLPRGVDGAFFIDRDPVTWQWTLSYLRARSPIYVNGRRVALLQAKPEPEPELEPQQEPELLTYEAEYVVLMKAQARAGFEMDSEKTEVIAKGTTIKASERRTNIKGVVRVRCDQGWVSEHTTAGKKCLQLIAEIGAVGFDDVTAEGAQQRSFLLPESTQALRQLVVEANWYGLDELSTIATNELVMLRGRATEIAELRAANVKMVDAQRALQEQVAELAQAHAATLQAYTKLQADVVALQYNIPKNLEDVPTTDRAAPSPPMPNRAVPARRAASPDRARGPEPIAREGNLNLTRAQLQAAIDVFEANHGLLEGRADFKKLVPGTHIVNQRCELLPGVLERYQNLHGYE